MDYVPSLLAPLLRGRKPALVVIVATLIGVTLHCLRHRTRPDERDLVAGGQLEDELAANAWLVTDPDETLIFETAEADKWDAALERIGVTPEHLSILSGNA